MSDLRKMLGQKLAEVLDVIDDDDDSAHVRIELSSNNAVRGGEGQPAMVHVWTLTVVGNEWQGERHDRRWASHHGRRTRDR